jgi:hypothetical protein
VRSSFDKDVQDHTGKKKVLVCGTRTFKDYDLLKEKLDIYLFLLTDPIIVTGGQKLWDHFEQDYVGADRLAEKYATRNMFLLRIFHADWNKLGKKAGPIRNSEMAKHADLCVAFWDGKSRGTADMIHKMRKRGKPVKIVRFDKIHKKRKRKKR